MIRTLCVAGRDFCFDDLDTPALVKGESKRCGWPETCILDQLAHAHSSLSFSQSSEQQRQKTSTDTPVADLRG